MRRTRTLAGTLVLASGASLLFGGAIYGLVRAAETLGWNDARAPRPFSCGQEVDLTLEALHDY